MINSYKLDTVIKVEEIKCKKCYNCVNACPSGVIAKDEFPFPTADSWGHCIDCGHCVAICPTGAMHQRSMGPEDCEKFDPNLSFGWDQVSHFLKTRRSIRGYKNNPVEKEKIMQLLDVTRWAPNGGNRQVLQWIVINDPVKVHLIAEKTIDWMKSVKEKNPALYQEARLGSFIEPWERGKDRISLGAPCIIMAYAKKDERTAPPSAMIAIAHIQLAAPSLGLGTTFTGSINVASQSYPPLIEALGIPEGHIPYGTFVIGYPTEKYRRIPVRKPIEVTWR